MIKNKEIWMNKIERCIQYLSESHDINGVPLLKHRRKTFVFGLNTALKSIKDLACYLLTKPIDPFSFLLVHKLPQDHL